MIRSAPGAVEAPSRLELVVRATRPRYIPTSVLPGLAGGIDDETKMDNYACSRD